MFRCRNMKICNMNTSKIWSKFVVKSGDGSTTVLRIIDLTKDLIDEFVDFQINHFVKKERIHQLAGLPNSVKALDEYKSNLKNKIVNPLYHTVVCCPEEDGKILPKIVASSTLKLLEKNNLSNDVMKKTNEAKKLFQIEQELNNLCPVHKVMEKYGVEHAFDYESMTVHSDYARLGIASAIAVIGPKICEDYNVKLTVGWMTSEGTQKAAAKNGWITEYEIKAEEVAKKYNVTYKNLPPFFKSNNILSMHATKTWSKFVAESQDGPAPVLRLIDLSQDLVDEFVEFQINNFIKKEQFRQMAGIPHSEEALDECRNMIKDSCASPLYHHIVCCPEYEGKMIPKILGATTLTQFQRNNLNGDVTAKTKEVKRFIQIRDDLSNLCPVHEVMAKYGVESAWHFALGVHENYSRFGIGKAIFSIGPILCHSHNGQMCYSWMTAEASQNIAAKYGWTTEFKIKAAEVAKKYNLRLHNLPPFFKFMICRI